MKRLVTLVLLGMLTVSCGGALRGGTIDFKPPVINTAPNYTFGVVACGNHSDPCSVPVVGAKVEVQHADGWVYTLANGDGFALMGASIPNSALRITADGFETLTVSIEPPALNGKNSTYALVPIKPPQAPLDKRDFIEHYQGNFGSIKVPDCGFYNDSLFDPVVLLGTWTRDKACFEKAMAAHAVRNDNRVVVDPRSDYHDGQGGALLDYWHDPATFRQFLLDVRAHRNALGEPFKVFLFLSADGHIPSFLRNGTEGNPDFDAEAHFAADVRALADATRDLVDGTSPCWECRHQRDYETPGTFKRNLKVVAEAFPDAWHGIHLVAGSSSWASWNCDPLTDSSCTVAAAHMEGDDPYRGNELQPWIVCVADKTCDGIAYQFEVGDVYTNPDNHPNYTGRPGALGRYFEIVVRMGRDPWTLSTYRPGVDARWPLNGGVDVLAFENIYDAYNNRSDEAYGIAFCKRALEIGGWGCGSASVRR